MFSLLERESCSGGGRGTEAGDRAEGRFLTPAESHGSPFAPRSLFMV